MVTSVYPALANSELANLKHDDFLDQSIQVDDINLYRRFVGQSARIKVEPRQNLLLAQADDVDIDFFEALEESGEEYQEEIESFEQTEPEAIEADEEVVEQESIVEPEATEPEEEVVEQETTIEPEVIEPQEEVVEEETILEPDVIPASSPKEEVFADDSSEIEIDEEETVVEDSPASELSEEGTEEVADEESSSEILEVDEVEVFGERSQIITPLPGVDFDKSQISTNIQTATGEEIKKSGAINVTQFLNEQMQSITVSDNSGNPFRQDLNFRGFSASPLIATPQGISIYVDGVRVNESFGDVINWDLIPLNAIDAVALVPGASPLFGLNTLAGTLSLSTKTGFTATGVDGAFTYGSWNRTHADITIGGNNGVLGGFLAYNRISEDGWRNNSPSDVEQIFGRADFISDKLNVSLSALSADNNLIGNGLVPVGDFQTDPEQVFTSPDITNNAVNQFNFTSTFTPNYSTSISALAYHRGLEQSTISGDFWDNFERAVDNRFGYDCTRFGVAASAEPNGANRGEPGVPGCIPNGIFNLGDLEQDTFGGSLQLNWITERNQAVFGATYDKYQVEFTQSQLIGFVEADRSVVVDPTRLVSNISGFAGGTVESCIDFGIPADICRDLVALDELRNYTAVAEQAVVRNRVQGKGTNYALFFYDAFNVTPKLTTTFGLRYNRTSVQNMVEADRPTEIWTFGSGALPTDIINRAPECISGPGDQINRFQCTMEDITFQSVNPSIGMTFEVNESVSTFANISQGTRTPSAIELACARPEDEDVQQGLIVGCTIPTNFTADPPLKQVRSTSYEVGTRMQFTNGIGINLSLFKTDLKDDILFLSLGRGNRGVFDNFGRTSRRGFELGLTGDHDHINWFLNYTNLKATFESEATVVNGSNSTAARGFSVIREFTVEPDDEIPGNPNHAIRAGIEFAFTPKFSLGFNLIAQSSSFARGNENNEHQPVGNDEFTNGQDPTGPCAPGINLSGDPLNPDCFDGGRPFIGNGGIDAFWVLNLDATFRPTEELTVSLQVDNVFDKRFATAGALGLSPFQTDSVNFPGAVDAAGFNFNSYNWKHDLFVGPGAPRAAWLTVRYTWDGW